MGCKLNKQKTTKKHTHIESFYKYFANFFSSFEIFKVKAARHAKALVIKALMFQLDESTAELRRFGMLGGFNVFLLSESFDVQLHDI